MKLYVVILCSVLLAKILSLSIMFLVDAKRIENPKEDKALSLSFLEIKKVVVPKENKKEQAMETKNNISLKKSSKKLKVNIKGVYINSSKKIAFVEYKSIHKVMREGDYLDEYKLLEINSNQLKFILNEILYVIDMKKDFNQKKIAGYKSNNKKKNEEFEKDTETSHSVASEKLEYFLKNPKEIWKNITFSNRNNKFIVTRINSGSYFYELGLRKGDEVTEINYEKVTNKLLFSIYRKIMEIDSIIITIKRDKELLEFVYEIN